ncbi:MAG: sugar ABC transporter substrate-binding protein [Caldilineaceae bacterium]
MASEANEENKLNRRAFLKGATVSMGAVLIAACAPASQAPASSSSGGAAPAAVGEPVPALLRSGANEEEYFNRVIDMFEQQHPDVKINRVFAPGGDEYITKLDLMIASGDPPAIYAPFSSRGYRYYAARGLSQELDELATRDNLKLDNFHADGMKGCHWNGKLMALPLDLWPHVLFYNKTLFDEAGVQVPPTDWTDKSWTYDTLTETAKALTKKEGDETSQFGIVFDFKEWPTGWLFGGDWFPKETYETGIITEFVGHKDERVIAATQWYADLMLKDNIAPTPAQSQRVSSGGSGPFFMSGKVAMNLGNIGSLSQYATIKEFEWGTAALPFPPDGSDRHMHVWIDFWSMIKGVKNLEGSWEFLKFMVSEEAQKIYPCEYGPQSALSSLSQYWIDLQKKTLPNLDDAQFKVLTEAPKYEQIDPENWTVNMSIVNGQGLQPALDRIWLGEGTSRDIITAAAPDIQKIIDESKVIS